jgi:hypothetical protein
MLEGLGKWNLGKIDPENEEDVDKRILIWYMG